jgi:hypothetical protein
MTMDRPSNYEGRHPQDHETERTCMMDTAMGDMRGRPRGDGSPGREFVCEQCGGVWAIAIGGRPSECRMKPIMSDDRRPASNNHTKGD